MPDMAAKKGRESMPHEQVQNVRRMMGRLLKDRFEDNKSEFGRAIGTSGQAISQILNGDNKPGWGTVAALRTYLRSTWDQVLAGEADAGVMSPTLGGTMAESASLTPSEGTIEHMGQMLQLRDLPRARYPQLEYAVAYHARDVGRWSPLVIMAARQGQFEADSCGDWSPPQWAEALDHLENILRHNAISAMPAALPPAPTTSKTKKS